MQISVLLDWEHSKAQINKIAAVSLFSFPISLFWTHDLHEIFAVRESVPCQYQREGVSDIHSVKGLLLAQVKMKCFCLMLCCNAEK